MKKRLPLLFVLCGLVAFTVTAQSNRIVLVEQVTSASCGPCAAQNPAFNTMLNNNLENLAVIKYQRGGGSYVDPMWDFNPDEPDYRATNFYGVFHFPNAWVDGQDLYVPGQVTQQHIDDALAVDPKFDIEVSFRINDARDEVTVAARFEALEDFQEPADVLLSAHVALIEKEVNYDNPPGFNGEKDFHWVMRKMFPDAKGTQIDKQVTGDITELEFTYAVDASEIDIDKIEAVAFVQRWATKEVVQAAKSTEDAMVSVDDPQVKQTIKVYPTVSNDQVTVEVQNPAIGSTVEVFDAIGNRVDQLALNGQNRTILDVSNYSGGLYLAVVKQGDQHTTLKFMVAQ